MKNIIVCDLDGTLADLRYRRHHVEHPARQCIDCGGKNMKSCVMCGDMGYDKFKPNWKAFHAECVNDLPLETTIEVIAALARSAGLRLNPCEVWIVSGRSDVVRQETVNWLAKHDIEYDRLIMRRDKDYTPDDQLKLKWLNDGTIPKGRVFCVFDDRDRVVNMWRAQGLTCYQVAPGDF